MINSFKKCIFVFVILIAASIAFGGCGEQSSMNSTESTGEASQNSNNFGNLPKRTIDSASKVQLDANAAAVDSYCKTYYSAGVGNNDGNIGSATVKDAIGYSVSPTEEYYSDLTDSVQELVYIVNDSSGQQKGYICSKYSDKLNGMKENVDYKSLTLNTALSELYL